MGNIGMIYNLLKHHKTVLIFQLPNSGGRVQRDIFRGVTNIKLFHDHITFVGKSYNDPQVSVRFTDIEVIRISFAFNTNKISKIEIRAGEARVRYNHPPGPDL